MNSKSFNLEYLELIALDQLFQAWNEFRKGKRKRIDVSAFERNLEDNIFSLYESLLNKSYKHGSYHSFYVQDPKLRHIHKATVTDRVIHHLLYKFLYNLFDKYFIYDSYSCRLDKGTHKGVEKLGKLARKVSKNYTQECWSLKCDIKKFFASVDHGILLSLLKSKIKDSDIIWLLKEILDSFHSENGEKKGIPLGNLTSQIFANIYMNELDQFVKHQLKVKYYLRYADDFIFLSTDKKLLESYVDPIRQFISDYLKLELHPNKIIFRKLKWGIDFLGYVTLPHYRLPRAKTRQRIFKQSKIKSGSPNFNQSFQSYLGYFSHASSYKLTQKLKNQLWYWQKLMSEAQSLRLINPS